MSADLLRRAAEAIRDEHSREHVDDLDVSGFYLAVADLLEDEADELMPATIADQIGLGATPEDAAAMAEILHCSALTVARLYLGSDQ